MYAIKAGKVITPFDIIRDALIVIENGRITFVGKEKDFNINNIDVFDFSDKIVIPGMIDIHIHGANGADVMEGTEEVFHKISKFLVNKGVVAYLPATVTAPIEEIYTVLESARKAINSVSGAKLLGIHMEGPYISRERAGSQDIRFIKEPKISEISELVKRYGDVLKRVTIAPEIPNGLESIRYLVSKRIIVSLGYTNANFDYAIRAFNLGARLVNHLFNAMRGFHHRDPGIVGATLLRNDVFSEIIPDGIHVDPNVMKLLLEIKGPTKTILISNSIFAAGLPDGKYETNKGTIIIKNGAARLPSGILVGSTLTMDVAVRNLIKMGIPMKDAILMATYTPAQALNIQDNYGSISVGKPANLAVIDEDMNVYYTIIDGEIVFKR